MVGFEEFGYAANRGGYAVYVHYYATQVGACPCPRYGVGGRPGNGPTYITIYGDCFFHVTYYIATLTNIHHNLPDYDMYCGVGAATPSADIRYKFFGFGWVRRVRGGNSFGTNPPPTLALGVLGLLKRCPFS